MATVKIETKPCKCGKKMIKINANIELLTNPPQLVMKWWCGGCGNEEPAGTIRKEDSADINMTLWQAAN